MQGHRRALAGPRSTRIRWPPAAPSARSSPFSRPQGDARGHHPVIARTSPRTRWRKHKGPGRETGAAGTGRQPHSRAAGQAREVALLSHTGVPAPGAHRHVGGRPRGPAGCRAPAQALGRAGCTFSYQMTRYIRHIGRNFGHSVSKGDDHGHRVSKAAACVHAADTGRAPFPRPGACPGAAEGPGRVWGGRRRVTGRDADRPGSAGRKEARVHIGIVDLALCAVFAAAWAAVGWYCWHGERRRARQQAEWAWVAAGLRRLDAHLDRVWAAELRRIDWGR